MEIESLIKRLIEEEDLKLHTYTDSVGKLSIGIGRNLTDNGITREEAIYLCQNDINNTIADLQRNLDYFDSLPENVQIVLADMCFNLGIHNLLTFHNTLRLIKEGKYSEAAGEMLLSKWAKQVGKRAIDLSNLLKSIS